MRARAAAAALARILLGTLPLLTWADSVIMPAASFERSSAWRISCSSGYMPTAASRFIPTNYGPGRGGRKVDDNPDKDLSMTTSINVDAYSPSPTLDPYAAETHRRICRALQNAIAEESGVRMLRVGAATRVATHGIGTTYRFALEGPLDVEPGTAVVLRTRHGELGGSIVRVSESALDVVLPDDTGYAVDAGVELWLETTCLTWRLHDRIGAALEVAERAPSLFNLPGALLALGLGDINVAPTGPAPHYENEKCPLNEEQERAVGTVLRSPLTILVAPPATGGSITLSAMVEACHAAGLRTLVSTPSGAALDNTFLRVCDRLSAKADFQAGSVLRLGGDASEELRAQYGSEVLIEEVTARIRPEHHEKILSQTVLVDRIAAQLAFVLGRGCTMDEPGVRELRHSLVGSRSKLRELRREARSFAQQRIAAAKVIGATLNHVILDQSLGEFDVVIIDRAEAALVPAIFLAAGMGQHVVLAGDPCQLSARVMSSGIRSVWLRRNVFERLDVLRKIQEGQDVPFIVQLHEQHRSAEALCEVQRMLWYGPLLRTAPSVIKRERQRANLVFGSSAIAYVNTAGLKSRVYRHAGRSCANDEHALVILDLIRYLDSAGEIPASNAHGTEILVLSPYRAQATNLGARLSGYRDRGVAARTVHAAHGTEATTCILDLTFTWSHPPRAGVLADSRPGTQAAKTLCSALAQARSRLIVVGDMNFVRYQVQPHTVLGAFFTYLREEGHEISLRELRG
jgi:hypothetical protein